MATLAQLQAEPWWDREIVTAELDWLGDTLCARTGQPRTAFGSKGNTRHLRGAHRSQEWIKRSAFCTSRTYTVQGGLTALQERHVAGADFVPGVWGTAENRRRMVEQTKRLVAALKAGRLDGVREVIGTLDGRTVVGTRANGSTFDADDSHLDHTHLTLDRRRLTDRALMERIAAVTLGEDDDMPLVGDQAIQLRDTHYAVAKAITHPDGAAKGRVPLQYWADWVTGALQALAAAVGNVDEATRAQLQADLAALSARVEAVPAETVEALGLVETPEEIAAILRPALGDKAVTVGQILAAG